MKITYDKLSDALYIKLNENEILKTREIMDSLMFDLDADGSVVGIEILYASKRAINPYEVLCQYIGEESPIEIETGNQPAN